MTADAIREELFRLRDEDYKAFQSRLIPTVSADRFIGIRTPELRKLAKEVGKSEDAAAFLSALPHTYFDENQLHAFIISEIKDFGECLAAVEAFLPYVDNWATCDQMSPKAFRRNRQALPGPVREWIASDHTYTVRFGIKMLMDHFLDEDYDDEYPEAVASVRSDEYYIKMMQAWYFATALAKQYDKALAYIEGHRLDRWTHNMTIRKAIESYRISPEQKEYLRGLTMA